MCINTFSFSSPENLEPKVYKRKIIELKSKKYDEIQPSLPKNQIEIELTKIST